MTESIKTWVSGELSFEVFSRHIYNFRKTSCNDVFPRQKTIAMQAS